MKLNSAPLWAAAFRPFFLLGIPCGLAVMAVAFATPQVSFDRLWHGHEMVFGFAGAIVSGIVLTALPSWAGTPEIKGRRLALLVALWLAGRVALALPASPLLPQWLTAGIDCALFPAMAAMLAPQLARVPNRWYLLALPGLLALAIANLVFHLGLIAGDAVRQSLGLHLAVYVLLVLYILKSGVFIPVFTSNELAGRSPAIKRHVGLEVAAVLAIVALGWMDLGGWPRAWVGGVGLAAFAINAVRLARWQGWRVAAAPLVFGLHLGIAFLVLALALRAAAAFTPLVPAEAWLHAFTVGGIGLCMIMLLPRVALRHTGRPLLLPPAMRLAYAAMLVAAALRLACSFIVASWPAERLLQASALAWVASFALYLWLFAPMFWRPSLPRS